MMKHVILLGTALSAALSLPVFALSEKEAEEAGRTIVPEEYALIENEEEDGERELEYRSQEGKIEVTFNEDGSLREYEYERLQEVHEKEFKLKEEEVIQLLKKEFPEAENIRVTRKTKKKESYYKVKFTLEDAKGEAEFSASSGTLNEYELEYGSR